MYLLREKLLDGRERHRLWDVRLENWLKRDATAKLLGEHVRFVHLGHQLQTNTCKRDDSDALSIRANRALVACWLRLPPTFFNDSSRRMSSRLYLWHEGRSRGPILVTWCGRPGRR